MIETATRDLIELMHISECEIPQEFLETDPGDQADMTLAVRPGTAKIQRRVELSTQMAAEAHELTLHFKQCTLDAILSCVKGALDLLRRRLVTSSQHYAAVSSPMQDTKGKPPVFCANIILALPTIVMRPSAEDIQQAVVTVSHMIVSPSKFVFEWGQSRSDRIKESQVMDGKLASNTETALMSRSKRTVVKIEKPPLRNYYKQVSENKEILKLQSALSTTISSGKKMITESFEVFSKYRDLWTVEREEKMKEFEEKDPLVSEFYAEMKRYTELQEIIGKEPDTIVKGPLLLSTEDIKLALVTEAKGWVVSYGRTLNARFVLHLMSFYAILIQQI